MVGVAAAIGLALVINKLVVSRPLTACGGMDAEQAFMQMELAAFSNLDADDQDFIIEVYDQDPFFYDEFDDNEYIYH